MKVLQIGATFKDGGPGYTTAFVHKELIEKGEDSKVFFALGQPSTDGSAVVFEKKGEAIIRKVFRKVTKNFHFVATPQTIRLIKMIKEYDPDIIHLRVIHHGFVNYILLFKFLARYHKPVLITLHDMWLVTGGCYHYHKISCNKFQFDCSQCPKGKEGMDNFPILSKYYRKQKEKYLDRIENLTIIAVSQWVNDEIKSSYLKNRKSFVITNAVDTDIFKPIDNDYLDQYKVSGNEKIVIGVATKWSENKGFSQFCKLADMLGEEYIIVLIGNPPNKEYKIPRNLHITGSVQDRNVLAYAYSSADVFVHLSSEETFGLVIAEAACCGKKVIGYDSTGVSEVVRRANGILVPKDEINKVASNIVSVCMNSNNLNGKELAMIRKEFALNKMKNDHINVYHSVL